MSRTFTPKSKRRKELRRKEWIKRGAKPMPKVNLARKARRQAEYAAFMRSAEWRTIRKAAKERAGFRCEQLVRLTLPEGPQLFRCTATRRLTVHHLTYARFGGRELPDDLQVLCKEHHDALHGREGWRQIA